MENLCGYRKGFGTVGNLGKFGREKICCLRYLICNGKGLDKLGDLGNLGREGFLVLENLMCDLFSIWRIRCETHF